MKNFDQKIILLFILFYNTTNAFAGDTTNVNKNRNSFFVEAGGKGPYYSVNYSRQFKPGKNFTYGWRAGFSLLAHDLSVPLAITAFTNSNGSTHHFEWSLGITPYLKKYKTFLHKNDYSDKQIYITTSFGYRYQKVKGKTFFSAGFDPLIFMDPPSDHFWNFTPELRANAHVAFGILW